MKKILVVLAPNNFRDEEYSVPREVWERGGLFVTTLSLQNISTGRFGLVVENDLLLGDKRAEECDGIFFVGGEGCLEYLENKDMEALAKSYLQQGKVLGAICAGPRLLLKWRMLEGKNFTGWNGDLALEKLGKEASANFTAQSVTVDGQFVTANGPDSAEACALAFLEALK